MLPDPLHPAVVHFPIVLAALAPLLFAVALWGIQTHRWPRRTWLGLVVLQLALAGTTWLATETGEHEEERVERVVAERHIEEHEESAERLLLLAALGVPIAAVGLLGGTLGTVGRGLALALSLATLLAAGSTGHSGGELVYRHGAAAAYTSAPSQKASAQAYTGEHAAREHREHDD